MIYTLTLNPALDYTMHLESFKKGEITRSNSERVVVGGKGINVSIILNELKTENTALGFMAGFTGRAALDELNRSGIKTDFITLSEGMTRINVKLREDGSDKKICETDILAAGPKATLKDLDRLIEKMSGVKQNDFTVLAGSVPSGLPKNAYQIIMKRLSKAQPKVNFAVDAAGDLLINSLKFRPFVIKPNHHELGELFGRKLSKLEEIIHYARKLQELGARNVLVSRGKEGAVLVAESGEVFESGTIDRKPIDTVGAGDSMLAGFISGFIKYNDYAKALALGTAAANATTFSWGLAKAKLIDEMFNLLQGV